jgi:hypothetical protein
MFLTTIMAENKRPPFDLPEGESELIAGYFIEYSGMRFGLFFMSEFIEVVVIAGLSRRSSWAAGRFPISRRRRSSARSSRCSTRASRTACA